MDDPVILISGIVVFSLMLLGVIMTILEFSKMPSSQKPEFSKVAEQAQPKKGGNQSAG